MLPHHHHHRRTEAAWAGIHRRREPLSRLRLPVTAPKLDTNPRDTRIHSVRLPQGTLVCTQQRTQQFDLPRELWLKPQRSSRSSPSTTTTTTTTTFHSHNRQTISFSDTTNPIPAANKQDRNHVQLPRTAQEHRHRKLSITPLRHRVPSRMTYPHQKHHRHNARSTRRQLWSSRAVQFVLNTGSWVVCPATPDLTRRDISRQKHRSHHPSELALKVQHPLT